MADNTFIFQTIAWKAFAQLDYYYLIAHNIINVYNILAVAVSVTAITSAVDDWHHCPHVDWFTCGDWQLTHSHRISSENTSRELVRFAPVDSRVSTTLAVSTLYQVTSVQHSVRSLCGGGGGGVREGLTIFNKFRIQTSEIYNTISMKYYYAAL